MSIAPAKPDCPEVSPGTENAAALQPAALAPRLSDAKRLLGLRKITPSDFDGPYLLIGRPTNPPQKNLKCREVSQSKAITAELQRGKAGRKRQPKASLPTPAAVSPLLEAAAE